MVLDIVLIYQTRWMQQNESNADGSEDVIGGTEDAQ